VKICPGPDCLTEIGESRELCAACKAILAEAPKMVEELERFLANHALFDAWLLTHHR